MTGLLETKHHVLAQLEPNLHALAWAAKGAVVWTQRCIQSSNHVILEEGVLQDDEPIGTCDCGQQMASAIMNCSRFLYCKLLLNRIVRKTIQVLRSTDRSGTGASKWPDCVCSSRELPVQHPPAHSHSGKAVNGKHRRPRCPNHG